MLKKLFDCIKCKFWTPIFIKESSAVIAAGFGADNAYIYIASAIEHLP